MVINEQHAEIIRGEGFEVEVVRTSRRKTATVRVVDGRVSVVVPRFTSQARVRELVVKKSRWIRSRLSFHQACPPPQPKRYQSGERFTYLGRDYLLEIEAGAARSVELCENRLVVRMPAAVRKPQRYVQNAVTAWYRTRALERLRERVEHYAGLLRVSPAAVRVRTYRARWGSCSADGVVTFNWKLIIAPEPIVDYVVVHELCHLHHFNHGAAFWSRVEQLLPDYRTSRAWLKVNAGVARL